MFRGQYSKIQRGNPPPKKPSRFPINAQNVTFVLSLIVQLVAGIYSLFTLNNGNIPPVLTIILTLETVVQFIELGWYVGVGVVFLMHVSVGVEYRYIDWVFTTPTMLVTLYFFVLHLSSPCMSTEELTGTRGFALFIALIIVADWVMLAIGAVFEIKAFNMRAWRYAKPVMAIGFVPLIIAFVPHLVALSDGYTGEGLAVVLVTLVVWAIYGVVAIVFFDNEMRRNTAYNILDLFSKNLAGLVVSIVASQFDPSLAGCPSPPPPAQPPLL